MFKKALLIGMTFFYTTSYSYLAQAQTKPKIDISFQRNFYLSQNNNTYKVKLGDTLLGIANKHGLSVEKLLKFNPALGSNPNLILIGQVINLNDISSTSNPPIQKQSKQRLSAFANLNLSNVVKIGNSRIGAKRGRGPSCVKNSEQNIKALLPESNFGWTLRDYPTFFWYLPELEYKESKPIPVLFKYREIISTSEDEETFGTKLYETSLNNLNPGIVSFTLPPEAPPLEEGKEYEWELQVHCTDTTWITIRSRIKRISTNNPTLANKLENAPIEDYPAILASEGVWYDILPIMAALKQKNPNDSSLEEDWVEILKQIGYGDLIDTSFVSIPIAN
jgi:Domain of Unknown Function (DUF928)/LysM domain